MTLDGHIDTTDKFVAVSDIENAVHKLRQAFEYSGEIKITKPSDTMSRPKTK
jgi:hypothetical protein